MKKILFGMCLIASVGLGTTSCGNGAKASEDADSLVSVAKSDSLSQYYGLMAGSYIGQELQQYAEQSGEKYDREEFIKGLQSVIGQDKSDAYIAGMNTAFRVLQDMKGMKEQGVQVNRELLVRELRKMVLADSISHDKIDEYSQTFQTLMSEVQKQAQAREEEKRANSPEAKANVKAGEDYLAKVAGLKKTQSGLGYVITAEGEGAAIKEGDRVTVNYEGKLLNGSTFDKGEGSVFSPGEGLIPGFSEGLTLLKKGAKATIYIPGKLAYGVNGNQRANIGPNEMLIFELEVVDVQPKSEQSQPEDNGNLK